MEGLGQVDPWPPGPPVAQPPAGAPGTGPLGAREAVMAIRGEMAKVVVGQDAAVSGLIAAMLVPGSGSPGCSAPRT